MGIQDDMKDDWAEIVCGDLAETVVYAGSSILALVEEKAIQEAFFEDGEGESSILALQVTDSSQLGYAGVTAPAIGDVVVARGETWRVSEVDKSALAGIWDLTLKRFEKKKAGPGRRGNMDRT